jgi:molybdopterin biosynthesis enzyme
MSQANCFIILGPLTGNVAAGEIVEVQMFDGVI